MKTLKNILFAVASFLLLQGCNDNDWSTSFADDELPKIYMNNWTATQAVNLGTVLKWEPIVSPSDGAIFKWTKNGEVLSEEKNFEYAVEVREEFELKFEVTRNGISTHRLTTIIGTKPFAPKEYNKKVIAYIDAMEGTLSDVNWEAVTHIVISSVVIDDEGEVDLTFNGSTLDIDNLINLAHNDGIYVSLQVSGRHNKVNSLPSYGEATFYNAISTPTKRDALITTLLNYVEEKGLDGIDVYMDKPHDNVYPSGDTRTHVAQFYQELADRVPDKNTEGFDFYLSVSTYVGWLRDQNTAFAPIDRYNWVALLAVAQEDLTPAPHSTVSSFDIDLWTSLGVAGKLIIVCPAFSITYDLRGEKPTWGNLHLYTQYDTYRDLLVNYPDAYQSNSINVADGLFYDGFLSIEKKAKMVIDNNYGGMALWKCGYDTNDKAKSLIVKINSALNK